MSSKTTPLKSLCLNTKLLLYIFVFCFKVISDSESSAADWKEKKGKVSFSLLDFKEVWTETKLHILAKTLQWYDLSNTQSHKRTHTCAHYVLCCPHCHDNPVLAADGFPRSFIYSSISTLLFHTHRHTCARVRRRMHTPAFFSQARPLPNHQYPATRTHTNKSVCLGWCKIFAEQCCLKFKSCKVGD